MVSAAYYVGTFDDHGALLDYLGEPDDVCLCHWPLFAQPLRRIDRVTAITASSVMVVNPALGAPIGLDEAAATAPANDRAGVFNQLNWHTLQPRAGELLVDSNSSPVLLWQPNTSFSEHLTVSSIGSQADKPDAISNDYRRWANRVQAWISRRGEKVWGLTRHEIRPDLDIELPFLNTVYALPGALTQLKAGARCR